MPNLVWSIGGGGTAAVRGQAEGGGGALQMPVVSAGGRDTTSLRWGACVHGHPLDTGAPWRLTPQQCTGQDMGRHTAAGCWRPGRRGMAQWRDRKGDGRGQLHGPRLGHAWGHSPAKQDCKGNGGSSFGG